MIPRVTLEQDLPPLGADFFEQLIESGFKGDVDASPATRAVFSTDNSIYQLRPQGVVFPKDALDLGVIATVAAMPRFRAVSLTVRGGGTGTNGQSLSDGVIVDCSRHMNRILSIDPVRRVAVVEAGVVKDQLNKALEPYGLFFAPELSTSNRATIGGMINTDACGQGSCVYGKTSNHVLGLRAILMDGSEWWSRPVDADHLRELQARQDRIGEVYRLLDRVERENRDLIEQAFPKLNRYLTGYDLAHLRIEQGGLNVNSVLCGAEGTLAMIAEAELNLLPIPACSALINIRYDNFEAALEDARALVALRVASVETVDEKVLQLAKGDIVWPGIARFFPDDRDVAASGINIVEVLADDAAVLADKVRDITAALERDPAPGRNGFMIADSKPDIEAIWTMRKRAVGLLGNVQGPRRPVAFVEDTAVPPENLGAYIKEFRTLLDAEGLEYGMFGHVDAGVLHVRPALDLTRDDHAALVRRISDGVVALTRKYGGVLWGEHGKGVRSEYVPEFFGDLYPRLQEIKRAFDPFNQLNPGKIAAPDAAPLMKIDTVPLRGALDREIGSDIRAAFDNAPYCNGNGACFDFSATSPMCPSFKGTADRRYSPKGRASLMREWLWLMARAGVDPRAEARKAGRTKGLLGFFRRAWNTVDAANREDFSHQVREAMDNCLACKACAGQCPVKVNVPGFRAKFQELYYGRYLRPLKDPLVAAIETLLPIAAKTGFLYNLFVSNRVGAAVMRGAGLTALPTLSATSLRRSLKGRDAPVATKRALLALAPEERARCVVFVQDAFTTHFEAQLVLDAVNLARAMGLKPFISRLLPNGKALHVHGYLHRFERVAIRHARYLSDLAATGVSLVGIDPSMTLTYRSEYPASIGPHSTPEVMLPQEWLAQNLDRLSTFRADRDDRAHTLFLHCTEKTNAPDAASQWARIFSSVGLRLMTKDVGCCGMAGTFGHETRNRALSERIYGLSWKSELSRVDAQEVVMATGYSCRSQVKIMESRHIVHPLQVLNAVICSKSSVVYPIIA